MGRRKKYHTKEERLRARREQNRLSELRTIERQSASPPPPPELTTIQYQPTAPRTQVNVTGPSLGISRKQDVAIHAQPTPPQTQVNVTCPSCGISRNQSVQLPHPQQVPSQDPQSQGQTFDYNNFLQEEDGGVGPFEGDPQSEGVLSFEGVPLSKGALPSDSNTSIPSVRTLIEYWPSSCN